MSYEAFGKLKEHVEIETLKKMSYQDINNMLNQQHKLIKKMKGVLVDADEYLNTNSLTAIGHGSKLHQDFKSVIGNA